MTVTLLQTDAKRKSPWPQLEKLEGRISDFVIDTQGNYVSPVFVRHLIGVMHNPGFIERYQLCQLTASSYELFLQIDPKVEKENYEKVTEGLEKDMHEVLGFKAKIIFKRVREIEQSNSGKFIYIKNLYRPKQN